MTAQILQFIPSEERLKQLADRWLLDPQVNASVHSLPLPSDFPIQYRRDDTAPSEMNCDSGDCA